MHRTRFIIAAWLLLLIPTLLAGGMAMRMLNKERQRLEADSRAAAQQRVSTVAESLDLAMAEMREGLLISLGALPDKNLGAQLEHWKHDNPLIRNVFIWTPAGLLLPDPRQPASPEEAAFVRRYEALFQGRIPWRAPAADPLAGPAASAAGRPSPRRELRQLVEKYRETSQAAPALASGWLPWFWQDRLFLLGWLEPPAGAGRRIGLEVEMMALLSRLIVSLPAPPDGELWTLIDAYGRIVHQSGSGELANHAQPLAVQAIGPGLPHWQLRIYTLDDNRPAAGASLRLLSALTVGSFVAAILFGGSLLLWQAWRHMRDARRKTSFVSNVSHELKTPLTTIRLYAELLAEDGVTPPERQKRYLRVIAGECQRLTRLVNNILDFGRLEQQRKRYRYSNFEAARQIREVLDSQQMRIEQAGMLLTCDMADNLPTVRADRDAFRQALLNLLDNALKYAADGQELTVELDRQDNRCRVAVKDRGPGIPPAHRERIFQAFHRVDDSLTAVQPGSGLGLSIARRLLRDMKGNLRYCSRADGGACFEMLLPFADDAAADAEEDCGGDHRRQY
jgi:signal transduction histidine kinase